MIGNSCGANHLGMSSWKEFAKSRELLEERASYLKDIRDLRVLLARNRDWIAQLPANPVFEVFDAAMTTLKSRHPELVRAVREASTIGGRLFKTVSVRDFTAEEKARERQVNAAKKAGLPSPIERPVMYRKALREAGTLRGRSVFLTSSSLRSQLFHLSRIVDAFLEHKQILTREDLAQTTRNARKQIENLFSVILSLSEYEKFFDPSNLILFVSWAEEGKYDGCTYSIEGNRLIISRRNRYETTLFPPPTETFEASRLEELGDAARGWLASQKH